MDDFNELYKIVKIIYEDFSEKEMPQEEFMKIFPKLKLFTHKMNFKGNEVIDLITVLKSFKDKNLLYLINDETVELVKRVHESQYFFGENQFLRKHIVVKHLLLPPNANTCDDEIEIFHHLNTFEMFFSYLRAFLEMFPITFDLIRTYNSDLYNLVVHFEKNISLVKEVHDSLISLSSVHIYSLFYFNKEKFNNDYSILDELITMITEKAEYFKDYCDNEGIKLHMFTMDDWYAVYDGILKLMNETYKEKRIKRKDKNE